MTIKLSVAELKSIINEVVKGPAVEQHYRSTIEKFAADWDGRNFQLSDLELDLPGDEEAQEQEYEVLALDAAEGFMNEYKHFINMWKHVLSLSYDQIQDQVAQAVYDSLTKHM